MKKQIILFAAFIGFAQITQAQNKKETIQFIGNTLKKAEGSVCNLKGSKYTMSISEQTLDKNAYKRSQVLKGEVSSSVSSEIDSKIKWKDLLSISIDTDPRNYQYPRITRLELHFSSSFKTETSSYEDVDEISQEQELDCYVPNENVDSIKKAFFHLRDLEN